MVVVGVCFRHECSVLLFLAEVGRRLGCKCQMRSFLLQAILVTSVFMWQVGTLDYIVILKKLYSSSLISATLSKCVILHNFSFIFCLLRDNKIIAPLEEENDPRLTYWLLLHSAVI